MAMFIKTFSTIVCCILLLVPESNAGKRRSGLRMCKVRKRDIGAFQDKFTCSNNGTNLKKMVLFGDSLCPWYYKIDYDPDRYPEKIQKAFPLSEYCIRSNKQFQCVPITIDVRGLKKTECKDRFNGSVWTESTIRQVVGFTCSKRKPVVKVFADYA